MRFFLIFIFMVLSLPNESFSDDLSGFFFEKKSGLSFSLRKEDSIGVCKGSDNCLLLSVRNVGEKKIKVVYPSDKLHRVTLVIYDFSGIEMFNSMRRGVINKPRNGRQESNFSTMELSPEQEMIWVINPSEYLGGDKKISWNSGLKIFLGLNLFYYVKGEKEERILLDVNLSM